MLKNILIYLVLFAFAVIAVFAVASFQKVEVHNKEDLRTISCGWPIKFIINDQSWRDPPYPWNIGCLAGELGDPTIIHWYSFGINVLVFYLGFAFFWETFCFVKRRKKM